MILKTRTRCRFVLLVLIPLIFSNLQVHAQQRIRTVSVTDFGIDPDGGKDATPAVVEMIKKNRNAEQLLLNFPKGRYDFYPDSVNQSVKAFGLLNRNKMTIEGNGSSFVFHSKMQPFNIEGCEDVTLRNFSIDWDRPYISQGQVVNVSADAIELRIDKQLYPYVIENERILFKGENWLLGVELYNLYDQEKKEISYRTLDNPMGADFFKSRAVEVSEGVVRFYAKPSFKPVPGTYVSMLHIRYLLPAIELTKSKNIRLTNIDIFHSLSMGVVGFRSENIELDDVNVTANEKKGRVFSAVADAFHFNTCKGFVKINNCSNTGQADDFVNIHGEYAAVKARADDYTLIAAKFSRLRDVKYLLYKGEEIWLIDSLTAQRHGPFTIKTMAYLDGPKSESKGYTLGLDKKIPEKVDHHYYIENKTWTPNVEIRNCRILKKNRARGILVTTPKTVRIENNYFNTAGAAILIEGDLNFWFESGGVGNITIRNNVFENCMTSGQYWGQAIINISPSFLPVDDNSKAYHNNIIIEKNEFRHFDRSVLFARSVQNLQFINNTLSKTNDYIPFSTLPGFTFDGCKKVSLYGNHLTDDFLGTEIKLKHMKPSALDVRDAGLKVMAP